MAADNTAALLLARDNGATYYCAAGSIGLIDAGVSAFYGIYYRDI